MRRGVFYALDAILAAALFVIMITAIFAMMQGWGYSPYEESALALVAHDTISVLDTNGTLSDAVINDNVDALQRFVSLLPGHMCASITIMTVQGMPGYNTTVIGGYVREGCINVTAQRVAIARRTFILPERGIHVAEARLWYR